MHPTRVLLSGGIDSAACLDYYSRRSGDLKTLFIDYGQPSALREREAAGLIADYYGAELRELVVAPCSNSHGYIPGRNALLVCLALMVFGDGPYTLALGIHDGTDYSDCSPEFEHAMQRVVDIYAGGKVRLDAPFLEWSKGDILQYARSQGVPLHLTHTSNPDDLTALTP